MWIKLYCEIFRLQRLRIENAFLGNFFQNLFVNSEFEKYKVEEKELIETIFKRYLRIGLVKEEIEDDWSSGSSIDVSWILMWYMK